MDTTETRYTVQAPTAELELTIDLDEGWPRYALDYRGTTLLAPSPLGFEFAGRETPSTFEVAETERETVDETWEQVWGRSRTVENNYRELRLRLSATEGALVVDLTFRVFDDGLGFRYSLPEQPGLGEFALAAERTTFRFDGDYTAWWIPATECGKRPCSWVDTYEKIHEETPLSAVEQAHTPITIEAAEDAYLAVHEAALVDWADMELRPTGDHGLESALVALPDGTKIRGSTPHESPWRTIQVGDRPGALVESNLVENLNEPCAIEDPSFVEPGTYVGVWWEMHKGTRTWHPGPDLGATTEHVEELVDFAAEHDIPYVLAEGWNVGWGDEPTEMDFSTAQSAFDLDTVLEYCEQRDVEFLAHTETFGAVEHFEEQLDETFALYADLGIPGVKTGYAGDISGHHRHDQWMVNHYRRTMAAAAEHGLMLDIHEPIKATGEKRTYPNVMTREGVRGMEIEAAPALGDGNPPSHTVTLPFTRMLAGPVDYTPGIFEILWDPMDDGTRVHTTRAHQLALYPILLSGLQMLADIPEHYEGNPELAFLESVPADWDETVVLGGEIGEYVSIARRKGAEWYVGTATDRTERTVALDMSFLEDGPYVAEVYSDAPEADFETNPTAVAIHERLVTADDEVLAPMAAGGGQAIRLRPPNDAEKESVKTYEESVLPVRGTVTE